MSSYGSAAEPTSEPSASPEPKTKGSRSLSDKQKADLKKHMEKHKDKMSASEIKSHRMKMMVRMRKGMSISAAHKDIGKKK